MVLNDILFTYGRSCIATLLSQRGGHRALYFAGVAMLVGALVGGVLSFTLVNVVHLFESLPGCGHV